MAEEEEVIEEIVKVEEGMNVTVQIQRIDYLCYY